MTEMNVIPSLPFWKAISTRHLVDPTAFALAMAGGPILVGVLGAPLLLVPSFAVVFGGPLYLALGIPVMLFYMSRNTVTPAAWAGLAFVANLVLFLPTVMVAVLTGGSHDGPSLFLFFGSIFAPLWGLASGFIYGHFERDFYKQTI